jgi:hypothetical protein
MNWKLISAQIYLWTNTSYLEQYIFQRIDKPGGDNRITGMQACAYVNVFSFHACHFYRYGFQAIVMDNIHRIFKTDRLPGESENVMQGPALNFHRAEHTFDQRQRFRFFFSCSFSINPHGNGKGASLRVEFHYPVQPAFPGLAIIILCPADDARHFYKTGKPCGCFLCFFFFKTEPPARIPAVQGHLDF